MLNTQRKQQSMKDISILPLSHNCRISSLRPPLMRLFRVGGEVRCGRPLRSLPLPIKCATGPRSSSKNNTLELTADQTTSKHVCAHPPQADHSNPSGAAGAVFEIVILYNGPLSFVLPTGKEKVQPADLLHFLNCGQALNNLLEIILQKRKRSVTTNLPPHFAFVRVFEN